LQTWQRQEIYNIYNNPHGTRRAILSFGRKNGKTTLASCLTLVHLCGPIAKHHPNSQIFSAAQSREQAAILFNLAAKMVRMNGDLASAVVVKDSAKELVCIDLGIKYRALSAEATTAFGLSPALVIHDELGQVRGPRSTLYEALETATGAQSNPLSIIISTQAPTDNDLLSILIDDALAGHDPHTVVSLYSAPMEGNPFDEESIRSANPALGIFLSSKEVMSMAADARRMPAREAEYRNLILNQRVQVNSPFIMPQVWKNCAGELAPLEGVPVYGGLDLSAAQDLTALVLIGNVRDEWHVHPTFWLPEEGLREKSIADRVPYDMWQRSGYLQTVPGKTVTYEGVARYLVGLCTRLNVQKIGFDRWNMPHLMPWLVTAGMTQSQIEDKFVDFGQGVKSMSPALRFLEQLLLNEQLVHGDNPVMNMCVYNTIIVKDDAEGRKPSKRKSTGRIDGLVALAMAVGIAPLLRPTIDIEALIG
jgi:phage terminase large subunit-like protein